MKYYEEIDKDFESLVPFFKSNQAAIFEDMKEALSSEDVDQLKFLVHRLKGTADNYGFKGLNLMAIEMEEQLEELILTDIEMIIDKMEKYIYHVEVTYVEI